jgi:hypothetical protein
LLERISSRDWSRAEDIADWLIVNEAFGFGSLFLLLEEVGGPLFAALPENCP